MLSTSCLHAVQYSVFIFGISKTKNERANCELITQYHSFWLCSKFIAKLEYVDIV
jgi:hypothetical protein